MIPASVDKVVIGDGKAVLYRADCRDILPMLGKVDAVITDPPWNVGKDYGAWDDSLPVPEYQSRMSEIVERCLQLSPHQVWKLPRYVNFGFWVNSFPGGHLVIIRRGAGGPLRHGWSDQFELLITIGKPNKIVSDLWDDIRIVGEGYFFNEDTFGHPGYTPYPIMARAVDLFSAPGQIICDPFMGTGTSGLAAIRSGRHFIGCEIEPRFFKIAVERISAEAAQGKLEFK
jgi:DNA modification methylase